MKEFSIVILVITGVLPIFLNYALHCVLELNEMSFIHFHSTFHKSLASFLFFYVFFSYGVQYPNMSFAVPFSHACLLVLWSQSLPLLWGMSPLSPLANDGQLKAHSQGPNQIYSPLIGLEEARGRAFISVSSFLFLSSCLRFGLLAGVACGGLSDGQKEELSAELGFFKPSQRRTDPPVCRRDMAAAVHCDGWQCFVCRLRICPQTGWMRGSYPRLTLKVESKKAGQRVKHHLAHSRTASASILQYHEFNARQSMSLLVFLVQIAELKIEKNINWSRNRALRAVVY